MSNGLMVTSSRGIVRLVLVKDGKVEGDLPCPTCGRPGLACHQDALRELKDLPPDLHGNPDAVGKDMVNQGVSDLDIEEIRAYILSCDQVDSTCPPVLIAGESYNWYANLESLSDVTPVQWLAVTSFQPPLVLFAPPDVPELQEVFTLGETAGLVMWSDAATAANCLRRALEVMVHDLYRIHSGSVPVDRNGQLLSLGTLAKESDRRINLSKPEKWGLVKLKDFGNDGSHSGNQCSVDLTSLLRAGKMFTYMMEHFYPTAPKSNLY